MSQPEDDEQTTCYKNDYNHTGRAFVFTNMSFPGGEKDSNRYVEEEHNKVVTVLENRGFVVHPYIDKTVGELTDLIKEAAKEDYSAHSCFLAVFSSHGAWAECEQSKEAAGDWTGQKRRYCADVILDKDRKQITIGELAAHLKPGSANESLNGKPKIFLMQCCRGTKFEVSINVPMEADTGKILGAATVEKGHLLDIQQQDFLTAGIPYHIPIWKDFFFHFGTVPGHYAWKRGKMFQNEPVPKHTSPFLQAWCDVLTNENMKNTHLRDLATFVNGHVVDNYTSINKKNPEYDNRKMTPQVVSMMTKDFYLKYHESI